MAINKDKEANIFSVARFGIVGDYKEVLPALIAKLKELLSKQEEERTTVRKSKEKREKSFYRLTEKKKFYIRRNSSVSDRAE